MELIRSNFKLSTIWDKSLEKIVQNSPLVPPLNVEMKMTESFPHKQHCKGGWGEGAGGGGGGLADSFDI